MAAEPRSRPDCLVLGIATVDAVAAGVDGYPPPGGIRFFERLHLATGGCAANSATALARLGVPCSLVTRAGVDPFGDLLLGRLAEAGVDTEGVVRDPDAPTPFTFVVVAPGGERSFLHVRGTNARIREEDVPPERLEGRRFVLAAGAMLMDALDGEPLARVLAAARRRGAVTLLDTVFVDAAPAAEWRRRLLPALPRLDWCVPSRAEARALTGLEDPSAQAHWLRDAGVAGVAVKLGSDGVLILDAAGREERIPACHVVAVVDTTGAGDCWCAGFVAGLREGLSPAGAARLGNAVAACCIREPGATTGIPPLAEVRERFRAFA